MKLLGIAGKKSVGKSTLARHVRDRHGGRIIPEAYPLKRFCVDTLGLSHEQTAGTEEQKNSITEYTWRDFIELAPRGASPDEKLTARQVMQLAGDRIRASFGRSVFIKRFLREARKRPGRVAVADDLRKADACDAVLQAGGKVVVLKRIDLEDSGDPHATEKGLDDYPRPSGVILLNGEKPGHAAWLLEGLMMDWGWIDRRSMTTWE